MRRVVIYPSDIQILLGISDRSARRYIKKIKDRLGKESEQFITTQEFAEYSGIPLENIEQQIR